uniref:DUF7153 domain-containing protein n=1 Tax=Ascaris lumbricoides TaxID=6252 RepID=A0A0M3I1J2_ASCLU
MRLTGYFFLAYKTMEHMSTMKFAQSWKTWSGARLICASLPQPYFFRRISFFRQSGSSAEFTYIVLIQINHLMVSAEAALNLASSFRQRLCAYVGVYREIDFTVDQHTGQQLRLRCSPIRLPSRPSISVDLRRLISPNGRALHFYYPELILTNIKSRIHISQTT